MRIGIFGGSFNPPHKTHKRIPLELISNNYLDKVIYVPTGNKYNKKDLINSTHRYNMLKIMTKEYSNLDVSDYELKQDLTYTYQTLNYFQNKYKNDTIYFICGTDNLKEITTWKNYQYILANFKLIVLKRNNDNIEDILTNINSSNIITANINLDNTSSTLIRNIISNNKNNLINFLDENIINYIEKNNLYKEKEGYHERNSKVIKRKKQNN